MKWLQKLGKALMLPVACLPICGILMGIGYLLCPSTMQGGDVVGFAETLGFFLVKAGAALIDNIASCSLSVLVSACPIKMTAPAAWQLWLPG